jgi:DNA-binding NarL/FixJ family response regulator
MSESISVLLVDDHAVVRVGYRRLLERAENIHVLAEAGNAASAYQAFCQTPPDVVVMDISLPDVSGIEAMRRLLLREPAARVLIFSIHSEPIFANRALQAGAMGYVSKASAPDVLVDAVRAVAKGERYLSPDVARTLALQQVSGEADVMQRLTDREFEIARLLAKGHSVRAVAELLCLNYKTVANYQTIIRQKLDADTPTKFMRLAAQHGLLNDLA